MTYRTSLQLLLAAAAIVPAFATAADQSARNPGAHELPAFVRERIELTPGTADEGEPPFAGAHSDVAAHAARFTDGGVPR